jgi:hypothetical protein
MGMTARQDIEVGIGSLPIHLRCVRDQNGKLVLGYRSRSLLNVIHAVEMGIADAAEIEACRRAK